MLPIVLSLFVFFAVFLFVSYRMWKRTQQGDPDIQALATTNMAGPDVSTAANLAVIQKTSGQAGTKYMQKSLNFGAGYICLQEEFKERFFSIVTEAILCGDDEKKNLFWKPVNRGVMWKLCMKVGKINIEGYMAFRETEVPKELYESDNIVLPDTAMLPCIENIDIVFGIYEDPKANEIVDDLYFRLLEAVELTQLKRIERQSGKADIGLVYRVVRNEKSVTLEATPNGMEAPLPKEILNMSYVIPAVNIKGTNYTPTVEQSIAAWRIQLLAGIHLAFFGDTGMGKSRLLEATCGGMGRNTDIVFLDPTALLLIADNPGLITSQLKDPSRWTILALDEAQGLPPEVVKVLLQFMDGNLKMERASFLLALNDDPTKVDPALVRDGRLGAAIKLLPLSPHIIDKLATRIQSLIPGRIKDLSKVQALAKSGKNPTLGQIWACCPLQQVTDKIVAIYRS